MTGDRVEFRVEPTAFDDPATTIVVEQVGVASPADGVTIAAGPPGNPRVVARIEFPHRMVDPAAVALLRRMLG